MNAANEIAVNAFLERKIAFTQMPDVVEHTMSKTGFSVSPDIEFLEISDNSARDIAKKYINNLLTEK
jgi:1-deoxy-D-xylulose-5-phosphate reductoisomerase